VLLIRSDGLFLIKQRKLILCELFSGNLKTIGNLYAIELREKYESGKVVGWFGRCVRENADHSSAVVKLFTVVAGIMWVLRIRIAPLHFLAGCRKTDFENFYTVRKLTKLAAKIFSISRHTLNMLLHYIGKLEVYIC